MYIFYFSSIIFSSTINEPYNYEELSTKLLDTTTLEKHLCQIKLYNLKKYYQNDNLTERITEILFNQKLNIIEKEFDSIQLQSLLIDIIEKSKQNVDFTTFENNLNEIIKELCDSTDIFKKTQNDLNNYREINELTTELNKSIFNIKMKAEKIWNGVISSLNSACKAHFKNIKLYEDKEIDISHHDIVVKFASFVGQSNLTGLNNVKLTKLYQRACYSFMGYLKKFLKDDFMSVYDLSLYYIEFILKTNYKFINGNNKKYYNLILNSLTNLKLVLNRYYNIKGFDDNQMFLKIDVVQTFKIIVAQTFYELPKSKRADILILLKNY